MDDVGQALLSQTDGVGQMGASQGDRDAEQPAYEEAAADEGQGSFGT